MKNQSFNSEEFNQLLSAWADGSLPDADWERFSTVLESSAEARDAYVEFSTLVAMLELAHLPPVADGAATAAARKTPLVMQGRMTFSVLGFLRGVMQLSAETPAGTALGWLAMASIGIGISMTIFFCIVLAFHGGGVKVQGDAPQVAGGTGQGAGREEERENVRQVEGETRDFSSSHALTFSRSSSLPGSGGPASCATVARLVHTADSHWVIGSHSPHVGDDLEPGRNLKLISGLAEIMFQSGVRAVLQGPAKLEVQSKTAARLLQGKLTVTVIDPDARGFEVSTPGMRYTDLGTEFGVFVAKDGTQEMHVFRGKVQAETAILPSPVLRRGAGGEGGTDPSSFILHPLSLVLSASQAVRVAAAGKPIEKIAADAKQFVRGMPAAELDLVDVVAGGDGLSGRRNRAINPSNGEFSDAPHGRDHIDHSHPGIYFKPDHKYHRVPASALIDGVFVVQGGGGPVQLDSAGHAFAKFPHSDALTSEFIWAVGDGVANTGMLADKDYASLSKFGSVEYTSAGHDMLYMRSNKGITFDLEAIRRAHPQYRLLRFTAVAGEPAHQEFNGNRGFGDFWVFVDGELRFEKRHVAPQKTEIPISVVLDPASRFLTLATTDGGDAIWGDWNLFGDPRLILGPAG
jgi:hypothetical protein